MCLFPHIEICIHMYVCANSVCPFFCYEFCILIPNFGQRKYLRQYLNLAFVYSRDINSVRSLTTYFIKPSLKIKIIKTRHT